MRALLVLLVALSAATAPGCTWLRPPPEVRYVHVPPCDLPTPPADTDLVVYLPPACSPPELARCLTGEEWLRLLQVLRAWRDYREDVEVRCGQPPEIAGNSPGNIRPPDRAP